MENNISELQQRQLDFLEDTIKYYSEDPSGRRSVENGQCMYKSSDGRKCAIGRFISDHLYDCIIEGKSIDDIFVEEYIPEKLKELGFPFLSRIQTLHDWNSHWSNEEGLSVSGKLWVERTKELVISGLFND